MTNKKLAELHDLLCECLPFVEDANPVFYKKGYINGLIKKIKVAINIPVDNHPMPFIRWLYESSPQAEAFLRCFQGENKACPQDDEMLKCWFISHQNIEARQLFTQYLFEYLPKCEKGAT